MKTKNQMKIGLSIRRLGYHIAAWRLPDVQADGSEDFSFFLKNVQAAEAAKLDFVFLADGVALRTIDEPPGSMACSNENVELEPTTLLAALAPMTKNIGLIATASTTYNEPYHIARRFSSLDHISGGRAGWNVVTSWSELEALNFNREKHMEHASRYERAKEFLDVVTGLWDSWESTAFLRDKASGVFYDPGKLHVLNHKGPHFQVRGPLTASRTPQGRPIIVQAGGSPAGQEIAAASADLVYTNEYDLPKAQAFYHALKAGAVAAGREPDDIKILPGIQPFVGRTRAEAQAKLDRLQELIHPLAALSSLFRLVGNLDAYDLDGPIPEDLPTEGRPSNAIKTLEFARAQNLTIRQLAQRTAGRAAIRQLVGTPSDIADQMEEWFSAGACDGFNVCPAYSPQTMHEFAEFVVPELQRRGLFRTEYEGRTMRENLGLRPYVNCHERTAGGG